MMAVVMITITDIIIACLFPIFACNKARLHVQVGELIYKKEGGKISIYVLKKTRQPAVTDSSKYLSSHAQDAGVEV